MVNWIKQYCLWIVPILFALFMLQTCRSCTKANTLTWTEAETTVVIDSLQKEITARDLEIRTLRSDLKEAKTTIELKNSLIESLKKDKEFLKESNTKLNSNLNKSLDKNEKSE